MLLYNENGKESLDFGVKERWHIVHLFLDFSNAIGSICILLGHDEYTQYGGSRNFEWQQNQGRDKMEKANFCFWAESIKE
jgi:hypothetical protein